MSEPIVVEGNVAGGLLLALIRSVDPVVPVVVVYHTKPRN